MRIFYIILALFMLYGCANKKQYLLINQNITHSTKKFNKSIGIKNIDLPQYLLSKNIPMLEKNSEIIYLKDKEWATYLDIYLTNRIVATLQKRLNSPNIYRYPQNSSTKPDIILNIVIHKFIADKNSVTLDASWDNTLFSIKVPIHSKDEIVDAMNRAFSALEDKLILDLENR